MYLLVTLMMFLVRR